MPRSGIPVNQAFPGCTIEETSGSKSVACRGTWSSGSLERGSKRRALGPVAHRGRAGLTHVFLRGRDVGHAGSPVEVEAGDGLGAPSAARTRQNGRSTADRPLAAENVSAAGADVKAPHCFDTCWGWDYLHGSRALVGTEQPSAHPRWPSSSYFSRRYSFSRSSRTRSLTATLPCPRATRPPIKWGA